jgi:hypothetical protein
MMMFVLGKSFSTPSYDKEKQRDRLDYIDLTPDNNLSNSNTQQYALYSNKSIEIRYLSNWGTIEGNNHLVRFFSPIIGPYLIGTGYIMAIDIPTVYDSPQDFITKVIWWNSLNHYWINSLEETSKDGNARYLGNIVNYSNFLKYQKSYDGFVPFFYKFEGN